MASSRTAVAVRARASEPAPASVIGVAAVALTPERRIEVPAALLIVGVDERVVGTRDEPPQAARDLAELLVDEHLVQRAPALPAERPGKLPPWRSRRWRGA